MVWRELVLECECAETLVTKEVDEDSRRDGGCLTEMVKIEQ
jgi:hypothetical protein